MVGALLGHKKSSTTERYAHMANNPVHDLAEKTGGRIAEGWNKAPADDGLIPFRAPAGGREMMDGLTSEGVIRTEESVGTLNHSILRDV
jgi:hypothetical protein